MSSDSVQNKLERYLLDSEIVSLKQLDVAKKFQRLKQGPLLILLWQMSFISLKQFGALMDWSGQAS